MTNREFQTDPIFTRFCNEAGIPATKRQASKWRRHCGRAWEALRGAAFNKRMSANRYYQSLKEKKS